MPQNLNWIFASYLEDVLIDILCTSLRYLRLLLPKASSTSSSPSQSVDKSPFATTKSDPTAMPDVLCKVESLVPGVIYDTSSSWWCLLLKDIYCHPNLHQHHLLPIKSCVVNNMFSIHNHKFPSHAMVYLYSKFNTCLLKIQTYIPHPSSYFLIICWISSLHMRLVFLVEGSMLAKISNHYPQWLLCI